MFITFVTYVKIVFVKFYEAKPLKGCTTCNLSDERFHSLLYPQQI